MKVEWERGNEGRIGKVVDNGRASGYGGNLENMGGYEVKDFDERDAQYKSGHRNSNRLNTYSDGIYIFGNENSDPINKYLSGTRENYVDLENEEIVKQTSHFFGFNLVSLLNKAYTSSH